MPKLPKKKFDPPAELKLDIEQSETSDGNGKTPTLVFASDTRTRTPQQHATGPSTTKLPPPLFEGKPVIWKSTGTSQAVCPYVECGNFLAISGVMGHYAHIHLRPVFEVINRKPAVLSFNMTNVEFNRTSVVAVLAYGGEPTNGGTAIFKSVCKANLYLSADTAKYQSHLPILLMARRTTFSNMFDKNKEDRTEIPDDAHHSLVLLWLGCMLVESPLRAALSAYNAEMTCSRSRLLDVHCFVNKKSPNDFEIDTTDCLALSTGELVQLTDDGKSDVSLEVIIAE